MITKKCLILLLTVCASFLTIQATMAQSPSEEQQTEKLEYQLIEAAENTWGYDIIMDGKLFVHQPFVPGSKGSIGFAKESQAAAAAQLVIEKIQKGIMPPSLTINEVQLIKRSN